MIERVIAIDFETYYASDYSLTDLPTAAYVWDPRFQIIGFSVEVDDDAPVSFTGYELAKGFKFLRDLQLHRPGTTVVAHNAAFDGFILEQRLKIHPWKYFCTAHAARPWVVPFTFKGRASLAETVTHLGLGVKGTEVVAAKGKRLEDFSDEDLEQYMAYCRNDTRLSYVAYRLFMQKYKDFDALGEIDVIDLTVKKVTRPQLIYDIAELEAGQLETESKRIELILAALPVIQKYSRGPVHVEGDLGKDLACALGVLGSNVKLADLMNEIGVDPPMKVSPTTGKYTYAFAKNDPEFVQWLMPSPHEMHGAEMRTLVMARLAAKSSQESSRYARFLTVSRAHPERHVSVPLAYYGAHTGRFSGMDRLNFQNLGRKSRLRAALTAPEGYVVLAGDESQIEARLTCCLAGQWDMVEQFRRGEDVYSIFAEAIYHYPVNADDNPDERFVGKQGILSLGFGVGAEKFCMTLNNVFNHKISLAECQRVVDVYREKYFKIRQLWTTLRGALQVMSGGGTFQCGPLEFERERVILPNGMPIFYPKLRWDGSNYVYMRKGAWVRIYPAKLLENCIQALARIVLTDAELLLAKHGMRAAHSVHDELVYVVRIEHAEACKRALMTALTAQKPWMPELPLDSKVKYGPTYASTK